MTGFRLYAPVQAPPLPLGRRYGVIYADPPWAFKTHSDKGKGRSPERHYPTMTHQELAALDLQSIAAPDCALFMWATGPHLAQAMALIALWGFEYKTMAFVWAKARAVLAQERYDKEQYATLATQIGTGYWTRPSCEYVLLATKGKPKRLEWARNVRQLLAEPRGQHSSKPEEIRTRIVQLMGDVPRIELFARPPVPEGWDTWGHQADAADGEESGDEVE